jgi:hypothetical protein
VCVCACVYAATVKALCGHTFHLACLAKCAEDTCPVCRFMLQPEPASHLTSQCTTCTDASDLWICIICGHLGCGRYTSDSHARSVSGCECGVGVSACVCMCVDE